MSLRARFDALCREQANERFYTPSTDTKILVDLLEINHEKTRQHHELLVDLLNLFKLLHKQFSPLTQLPQRIERIMQELDDLKTAVQANTDATAGNAALITQQRGTIDTQAQQIKDLQAQIAAGGGSVGVGVDPAELVPLTKQITDNNNALVDATMPPAAPPAA